MSIFKERAELKNASLKKLIGELEKSRDLLLDEVANKKGQVEQIEKVISRCYEVVLDNNKEEQQKEAEELTRLAKEQQIKEESEKKEQEKQAFFNATKGLKTPKREKNRG